jgi:hypothetical protein
MDPLLELAEAIKRLSRRALIVAGSILLILLLVF